MRFQTLSCAFSILLLASCDGGGVGPEVDPLILEADGFTLTSEGMVTQAQAQTLMDALVENSQRIQDHLQVAHMPHILIRVWHSDHSDAWYSTMSSSLGTVYEGATGYLWGPGEMRLLLNPESPIEVVHEYAHLVSMQVNPSIPNNPRWLWEAVATYEAGQLYDPSTWTEAARRFPSFEALNSFNSALPYRWGYLISEAVLDQWGDEAYLELIRANGRTGEVLGVAEAEFATIVEAHLQDYL